MAEEKQWLRSLRNLKDLLLPKLNFIILHYTYFIATSLITAIIFWGSSTPAQSVSFIDALFLTTSAMTEAGLNTINLSTLNTWQQFMLFALIMAGSAIWVSIFVVHVRLRAFEREFAKTIKQSRLERQRSKARARSSSRASRASRMPRVDTDERPVSSRAVVSPPSPALASPAPASPASAFPAPASPELVSAVPGDRAITFDLSSPVRGRRVTRDDTVTVTTDQEKTEAKNRTRHVGKSVLSYMFASPGWTTRHTDASGLTWEERQDLGGREYYAILFLSFLVPIYFISWQVFGFVAIGAWTSVYHSSTTRTNGIGPFWTGSFNAISAFNNSGMSLLDANMTAFQGSPFILLIMGLLIVAGNTGYPIFLRFILWLMLKLMPKGDYWNHERETLAFLLEYPRRCYTNLFPSRHTWWLLATLVILNGTDWAMFGILNIGNEAIDSLGPGVQVLDGLFQALAVRSGGFYVVAIAATRISLQVLYVIMMFISAYPVAMTIRHSNIYEDRSLGIFKGDVEDRAADLDAVVDAPGSPAALRRTRTGDVASTAPGQPLSKKAGRFLQQQVRLQLTDDMWLLALAVFLISIIENSSLVSDPVNFSLFNILFEVVSGYATCGISVGIPWAAYSFCGTWHALSKLIMVGVMIKGRHRGLPVAIDSAVQLPIRREDTRSAAEAVGMDKEAEGANA